MYLQLLQVGAQIFLEQDGKQNVPISNVLHMAIIRRRVFDIRLGVVERAHQERDAFLPAALAHFWHFLEKPVPHVSSVLHRALHQLILNEWRGGFAFQTLLRRAQTLHAVRRQRDCVVKVRVIGVALDGFFRKADSVGDALLHNRVLDVQDVGHVLLPGVLLVPDRARTMWQRVGPHLEREAEVVDVSPSRFRILRLKHAVGDGKFSLEDKLRLLQPECVQVKRPDAFQHRALELARAGERQIHFAAVLPVVHADVAEVRRHAALDRRHEPVGIEVALVVLRFEAV